MQNPDSKTSLIRRFARSITRIADVPLRGAVSRYLASKAPKDYNQKNFSAEEISEIRKKYSAWADRPLPTERELKTVDIVMLKYKDPEVEVRCAHDIIMNTDWPYRYTIFDNRIVTKNISKIWNRFIRESKCDYILIINSDAFVPRLDPCWLTRLMDTFDKFNDCFLVVPRLTETSCKQQLADHAEDKPPEKLTDILAAPLVLYKKEIFDKIGYFDEDFLVYGQDTEWGMRLRNSSYSCYLRNDVLVQHLGAYANKKASKAGEYDKFAERAFAKLIYEEKTKKYKTTSLPK